MPPKIICFTALTLIAALVSANAEEPSPDIETLTVTAPHVDGYLQSDVDTATHLGLSVIETPQGVSSVSREQLDDFEFDNLNEALGSVTGVQVEQVETDRTYYTARGFDISNFQIDGVGLPIAYGNAEGEFDTALVERIEVLRGANGLMSGAGNPSATVNVVRKRPTARNQLNVSATAGSWDRVRLQGDVSYNMDESLGVRMVLASEEREAQLDRYALQKHVAYAVAQWRPASSAEVTVGASFESSDADSPLWGALPLFYSDGTPTDYERSASTSADWSFWDNDRSQAFVQLRYAFSPRWSGQIHASASQIDGRAQLLYMYGSPDPATDAGLSGWASAYDLEEQQQVVDAFLSGSYTAFGREHDLVLGASWMKASIEDMSLYDYTTGAGFPVIGNFSAWRGVTPRPTFADAAEGSDWNDEQIGLYGATRFRIADPLSLIAGVRMVEWDSQGMSYGESQNARASGKLLPYAGAVYQLSGFISAYVGYTRTFMPQRDIGADLLRLAPAEGESVEAGIKAEFFGGRLLGTVAVFDAEHQNVSEYAYFDTASGQSIYAGRDYHSHGYEIELVGQPARGLQMSFGYTHTDINSVDASTDRAFVPRNVVRLFASYRPPFLEQLKLGVGVNWQDEIKRAVAPGEITQDSYALLSAFVRYQLTDQLSLAVNLDNLADEKYVQSLYWEQGYYGPGRNGSVTLSWRL